MTDAESKALQALLSRAEAAKQISDQITCLSAYDDEKQRVHVKVEEPYRYNSYQKYKWPDEYDVRAILELGRQTKLKQLQESLQAVLGVSIATPEGIDHAEGATAAEENDGLGGTSEEDCSSSEQMQEATIENSV